MYFKPFTLSSLKAKLAAGRREVVASDDLVYVPRPLQSNVLPNDLRALANFLLDDTRVDLLSDFHFSCDETTIRGTIYADSE